MSTQQPRKNRVTGHVQLRKLREGPVWYLKTRVPGRTPEQTTTRLATAHLTGGPPPTGTLTRKQADEALDRVLVDERHKVGHRAYEHGSATFADAAAGYLHYVEHVRGRERATLRDYRGSIDRYLNPRWGELPVDAITTDDVEALRDELLSEQRLSARSITRHLTVAHGVFRHAMRRHGLTSNPAAAERVDRPTVRYSGEFRTLDAEQLAALARCAATEQDAALYLAAAMTGMRQGELRALRWSDVDFAADRIHVRRSATIGSDAESKAPKSGRVRSVPMVPHVAAVLARLGQREQYVGDDDLVFPNAAGPFSLRAVLRARSRSGGR